MTASSCIKAGDGCSIFGIGARSHSSSCSLGFTALKAVLRSVAGVVGPLQLREKKIFCLICLLAGETCCIKGGNRIVAAVVGALVWMLVSL